MSAQLQFKITNQLIERTDSFTPASDSVDYLRAGFTFLTDEWLGGDTIVACFAHGDDVYKQILDSNHECFVPWEIIKPGHVNVSCYTGSRVTVNVAKVYILESGYSADAQNSHEPTPEIYEQILEKIDYNAQHIDGGTFKDWYRDE